MNLQIYESNLFGVKLDDSNITLVSYCLNKNRAAGIQQK